MTDTSKVPSNESNDDARAEAARLLVRALDEAHWARVRSEKRTRVIGVHGTDFESRDARVELIVEKFNERAVKKARKNALRAGWTKEQLATLARNAAARVNGAAHINDAAHVDDAAQNSGGAQG